MWLLHTVNSHSGDSVSTPLLKDVHTGILDHFTKESSKDGGPESFNTKARALLPGQILTTPPLETTLVHCGQAPALKSLRLTMFMASNNTLSSHFDISQKVYTVVAKTTSGQPSWISSFNERANSWSTCTESPAICCQHWGHSHGPAITENWFELQQPCLPQEQH